MLSKTMSTKLYQRSHQKSLYPATKSYRFLKLPLTIDTDTIEQELTGVDLTWLPSQWKWHLGTYFCILRAGPAGDRPGDEMVTGKYVDAPILKQLPVLKQALDTAFPAPVPLAWLGLSPPHSYIYRHIDNTAHWDEHHRIHVPLVTNSQARLCCEDTFLHLSKGSAWAFNNSRPHGACNLGTARTHLILDLPSTSAIEAFLASGETYLGDRDSKALTKLSEDPLKDLSSRAEISKGLRDRLMQQ